MLERLSVYQPVDSSSNGPDFESDVDVQNVQPPNYVVGGGTGAIHPKKHSINTIYNLV